MGRIGRCGNERAHTVSGVIGEESSLDAPCNGRSCDTAVDGMLSKCTGENRAEYLRNSLVIHHQNHNGNNEVNRTHKRSQKFCHLSDSLNTAHGNHADDHCHADTNYDKRNTECTFDCGSRGLGLHGRKQESRSDKDCDTE